MSSAVTTSASTIWPDLSILVSSEGRRRRGHPPTGSSSTTTPPAPATKYRPSVPHQSLGTTPRLIDVLRAGGRRRLVFIHAPSGFGKSTLAAQWGEDLSRDGVAVAWLTIDDDDNNVVWFLSHLLESIRRVRPELAASLGPALEEHGEDAERYVLTSLIDEIHGGDHRIAVVIDDWHRVTDTGTIAALGYLLDNGCHHLQVIVTSWSQSGLPLSKMRIRDELVEIDSTALRFDADEARSFFSDVAGLELSRRDVDALTTSTDGWVAALQLASCRFGVTTTRRACSAGCRAATTSSANSSPRMSWTHWNRRSSISCCRRLSPSGPAPASRRR